MKLIHTWNDLPGPVQRIAQVAKKAASRVGDPSLISKWMETWECGTSAEVMEQAKANDLETSVLKDRATDRLFVVAFGFGQRQVKDDEMLVTTKVETRTLIYFAQASREETKRWERDVTAARRQAAARGKASIFEKDNEDKKTKERDGAGEENS